MILNNRAACRICLCTNVKFYHLEAFQLKTYYEEIINEVLTDDDELLNFFCYQCSALLQKYHSFRQLCIKSQETLKKVTTQNFNISFEATLQWEQYNSKIHPLLMKLNSNAKLGYFEYEENDITVDDPFVNNSIQYYAYSDVEQKFELKFGKNKSDYNNDANENVFEVSISQESNNVDISTSSVTAKKFNFDYNNDASGNDFEESSNQVSDPFDKSVSDSDEKRKSKKPSSKAAGCRKKEKIKKPVLKILKPTECKKGILRNEEASNELDAKMEKLYNKRFKDIYDESENDFEDSTDQESDPVDQSISDSEEKKIPKKPISKVAKRKYNRRIKKEKIQKPVQILDPKKWKKVVLSNEDASKEIDAKIEKQYNKPFKHICEICQMSFKTTACFNNHITFHNEAKGNYECFFCKKRYATRTKLALHIKLHLERYHCLQCPQVFCSRTHTNLHEKYHEGVNYVCPHCNATFQKRTTYYGHLRIVHRSSHVCQFCGESFVSKVGLDLHRNRAHKSKDTGDMVTHCDQCDIMFENPQAFVEHVRNSVKHVFEEEDVFGQSKLLKGDPKKSFYETNDKCDQCAQQFSSRYLYNRHMRRVHDAPRPKYESSTRRTICEICGSSVLFSHLQIHMDRHAGILFPCPDCGKSYNLLGNMQRHRRKHKNPRRFSCELCGKTFAESSGVKLHVKTVHLKQPQPPRNRTKMKFSALGNTDE